MACLSAFRNSYCNATEHTLDDRPSPETGTYKYTEDEWTADAAEVRETTLVVININDDDFYKNIFRLSELYNQDCFLYKRKNSSRRYIIGTNLAEYPGCGNKVETKWVHENIIKGFLRTRLENSCLNSVKRCK